MQKKITAMLFCAMLLVACGSPVAGGKVEDMLRAPQAGMRESAIQKTLTQYLGETPQLKYPRGGVQLSPILFEDLDADGTEEAVALYLAQGKGQNVHLAVLEQNDVGWRVAHELEGLSTEVACVEFAEMTTTGKQLVVGYANATLSDAYLSVYGYAGETATRLFEQSYTQFLVADLDGEGASELLLIPQNTEPGALSLQLVGAAEDTLRVAQILPIDERFVACKTIQVSQSAQRRGLVIDGVLSSGAVASQVFRLTEGGQLTTWPLLEDLDVVRRSQRYLQDLPARAMRAQGAVFVPTGLTVSPTLSSSRRFYFAVWQDYLEGDPAQFLEETLPESARYGVYDANYAYFLRLPAAWRDQVNIMDGTAVGDWQVRTKEGNTLLLSVRIASPERSLGLYNAIAELEDKQLQVYFTDQCPVHEASLIRRGVTLF